MKKNKFYKYFFPSLIIAILFIGILLLEEKNKIEKVQINPPPTETAFSEGHEEGEWRNKLNWIESMHKCDSTIK